MASVNRVSLVKFDNQKQVQKQNNKKNIVQLSASNPQLLENFLSLMANQNKAVISFGYAPTKHGLNNKEFVPVIPMSQTIARPFDQDFDVKVFNPTVSDYCKNKILNESTVRINGTKPWPKMDNINAWMVTSETAEFKSDGGLGQVAADLPNSFNKRFKDDSKNEMTNVTPMYVNGDNYRLEETEDGKFIYHYGRKDKPKQKEVEYLGTINVPVYHADDNARLKDTDVRVFSTLLNASDSSTKPTRYIFLEVPEKGLDANGHKTDYKQIFNILDENQSSSNHNTPYANNDKADSVFRMAFFSKSVYELMKSIKEGDFKGLKAPNAVLLNDWQSGSLAAMMHYTANAEADTGVISKETGRYFDEIPTIYIAHNCEHQGATNGNDENRTNIFGTLFGAYGVDILPKAKSWDQAFKEDKCSLMRYYDFNSAKTGMTLVDRVVPVSEYYGEELIHSNEKARGLMHLMKARKFAPVSTLTPITNGYSKSLVVPDKKNMEDLTKRTISDFTLSDKFISKMEAQGANVKQIDLSNFKLLPFDDGNLANKIANKNMTMDIFKQLIKREKSLPYKEENGSRLYMLYGADKTEINETDFTHTPVIAYSGRVDYQKGLDTILKEALWKFAEHNKNTPAEKLPIFIIGGSISNQSTFDSLKNMKDYMTKFYPNVGKRIVLINGYLNTNLVASAADLFLVPSVFEPCGLTQMEAMAKGALPIATSTGGLVNTIKDSVDGFRTKAFFDETGDRSLIYGGGFSNNYDAYCDALERGLDMFYNNCDKFAEMQKTAMQNDFSWDAPNGALDKYINLIKTGKTN